MKHAFVCCVSACRRTSAQSPVDLGTISRIKQEALTRSQVMDHVGWMSDVYGPRVTGTPNFQRASEWAMKRFTEWGLANVHQERFAFGQGWRVERFSAHIDRARAAADHRLSAHVLAVDQGHDHRRRRARRHPQRGGLREVQRHAQGQDRAAAAGASRAHARGSHRPADERTGHRGSADDADSAGGGRGRRAVAGGGGAGPRREQIAQFYVAEGVAATARARVRQRPVGRRQRPVVADAAGRWRHDLPGRRRQPRSEGAARRCRRRRLPSSTTTAWFAFSRRASRSASS